MMVSWSFEEGMQEEIEVEEWNLKREEQWLGSLGLGEDRRHCGWLYIQEEPF